MKRKEHFDLVKIEKVKRQAGTGGKTSLQVCVGSMLLQLLEYKEGVVGSLQNLESAKDATKFTVL